MAWRTTLPIILVLLTGCGSNKSGSDGTAGSSGNGVAGSSADGVAGSTSNETAGALNQPSQLPPPDPSAVVVPNLDSAVIKIDPVAGAKDYRAYVLDDSVQVSTDASGHEKIVGATIYCAGLHQRAAPALAVPEVVQQIEVYDLKGPTTYVLEAIDQVCPFPGMFGLTDDSIKVLEPLADLPAVVPISSEATIRAKYGSMIINGHGGGIPHGMPANPSDPKVLKRWTVKVSPIDAAEAAARKTKTFFADFSEKDQPQWIPGGTNGDGTFHEPEGYGYSLGIYQNSQFDFYATNTEPTRGNHAFIDRGSLQINLPDANQDVMGTVMAVPRKAAHFSDSGYLHVTYENSTNSTPRRYWWLSLCGPEQAGTTFDDTGLLSKWISLNSGFFDRDGLNPSTANWNCLIVFPHDGIGTPVPTSAKSNPQSSVIVLIHKANTPQKQSAVNVSPQQLNAAYPAAWFRQMKGGQVSESGVLDDLIQMAPRVHFDLYVSRTRLIMYVNGEQRICNNFGSEKLTMAEAAIGFNDALYHSAAEHTELTASFADRSGQLWYLNNTPYADVHNWDNVGFEEDVALPSTFSDADCYTPSL